MCNKNNSFFGKTIRSFLVKLTASILSLFLFGLFSVSNVSAFSATITVPSTTNLDVAAVGNSASVSSGNVVVDSTCPLGYTVSISGPSDNTLYKDGDNTESNTIPATSGTVASPASILGNNLGTWGYTTTANATINSNFIGLPSTATTLLTKNTASVSGGDNIPITYGVSVPTTLIPGNYTLAESSTGAGDDVIIYYLTPASNCASIKIVYNDNGANSSTTMSITHTVRENNKVKLAASNYQRSNYGFAGWSLIPLNADSSSFKTDLATALTNGDVFGPNEQITINSHVLSKVTVVNNELVIPLYAIWVKAETGVTLQTWAGCNSMNIGDVTALKDARDNDTYAVAKLVDGVCWMIENLRLDYDADFTESLSQGFGKSTTYGNFIGLAEPETDNVFTYSNQANSIYYSGTQSGTASININTTHGPQYRFPRYRNDNTNANTSVNPNTTVQDMTDTNQNVYSYGNYYTWSAAKANTIYYDRPASTDADGKTSDMVNTSICPAGWRLPYGGGHSDPSTELGGTSGGFYNLSTQLGGDEYGYGAEKTILKFPNNFIYSGYVYNINPLIRQRGVNGFYWSSTSAIDNLAYFLDISSSWINPGIDANYNNHDKARGFSVRCVAEPTYTISFNANGGTGTMDDQYAHEDIALTLAANAFTAPSGKTFIGWNTAADGSGIMYSNLEIVKNLTTINNTITLYAQWECGSGKICYDQNGTSSPTKMGKQAVASSATSATLWASNFQRPGYGFAGWNTAADGSGTSYGPNEDITDSTTLNAIQSNGLILYAMWIQSAGTLQSWAGCNSMDTGDVTALTDQRDNETYAIAKLADNNCWMIENLRLDYDADFTESLSQGFGKSTTYGNFIGLAYPEVTNFSNSTTVNSVYYSGTQSGTASVNINTTNNPGHRFPRYRNDNTNSDATKNSNTTVANMTDVWQNVYSYGNYYTWPAAMANTIYYSGPTATDTDGKTSETVETSICPDGWKLPYGRNTGNGVTSGGFYKLGTELGATSSSAASSKIWRRFPNNFVYSGYAYGSSVDNRGSDVIYWSSTAYLSDLTYVLYFSSSSVYPGTGNSSKFSGLTVRCIAEPDTGHIIYDDNGANSSTKMGKQAVASNATTATLWAPNFKRDDYGFAGWNTSADGSGTSYGPNETISDSTTLSTIQSTGLRLYAMWVAPEEDSNGDELTFQTTNLLTTTLSDNSTLDSKPVGYVTALRDERDDKVYAVAKLSDGKYWMTENLRLDHDADFTESLSQGFGTAPTYNTSQIEAPFSWDTKSTTLTTGSDAYFGDYDQQGLRWTTHYYYAGGKLAYCANAEQNSASGTYQANVYDGDSYSGGYKKSDLMKLMAYIYQAEDKSSSVATSIYSGWVNPSHTGNGYNEYYAYSHAVIGYIYDGVLMHGLDNNTYVVRAINILKNLISTNAEVWQKAKKFRLYRAITTASNMQDIVWLEAPTNDSFIGLASPETNLSISTTANSKYYFNTASGTATKNVGYNVHGTHSSQEGLRIPRYNNNNTNDDTTINPNTTVTKMTDANQNVYDYGNYYTWNAAIASMEEFQNAGSRAEGTSICPAGWGLPYGGASNEGNTAGGFYYLNYKTNNNTNVTNNSNPLRKYPANFVFSGKYSNTATANRGTEGYYWSSTVNSYQNSINLYISMSNVNTTTTNMLNLGLQVRCVLGNN